VSTETKNPIRLLSLGAGVQSSTLYLMASRGEFGNERPELAIFADTQWEPPAVYEWLARLEDLGGGVIPIRKVTQGNIREDALKTKLTKTGRVNRVTTIPLFVKNPDGTRGMLKRQCTRDYKIRPIARGVRQYLAEKGRTARPGTVEQWIGISTDEAKRAKESQVKYIVHRHPLLERNMSRADCLGWLAGQSLPLPPKSACIGCPYTGPLRLQQIMSDPAMRADLIDFDRRTRHLSEVNGEVYVHASRRPLEEVDIATFTQTEDEELYDSLLDMEQNSCNDGVCGR
jgi:hypothetical protein